MQKQYAENETMDLTTFKDLYLLIETDTGFR